MANEDSFIDEVSDELRRDRLFAALRRYGWIAILLVVIFVIGAAVFEWRRAQARAEAQATGDALIAAMTQQTPEARAEAIAGVSVEGTERSALVALIAAAADAEAGNAQSAVDRLDAIVANADVPQTYRDLASLKSVFLGAEVLTPEDKISRLGALTTPGNGFRLIALEQRALAEIEGDDTDAALETLQGILADASVTQDLRARVSQLIVALGGSLAESS